MVRHRFRIAVVVLLAVVCLVVYRMASQFGGPTIALPTPQERALFTVDFMLPDMAGNVVRLFDLRGRPILLNIWATWCYPCRAEMPSMNALYQDYRTKGLAIVAVATDQEGKPVVAPFLQSYRLTFPVLLQRSWEVSKQYGMFATPIAFLIDEQGVIDREAAVGSDAILKLG